MANPNIVNVTTIYGNTAVTSIGTTYSNAVANPTSSGSLYKVNTLIVTNSCTAALSVTLQLNNAGTNTTIASSISIPSTSAVALLGKDTQIYLLENNSLQINASSASYLTAICSWEQIS
jgi:dTDP-4-amino-4,6-dideoxygalactose transaminase